MSKPPTTMSRLSLYYTERILEKSSQGNFQSLSGTDEEKISVDLKSCSQFLPYDISKFSNEPVEDFYCIDCSKQINGNKITADLNEIDECLLAGKCIVFGFKVYSSFDDVVVEQTGNVPIPDTKTEQLRGATAGLLYRRKPWKKSHRRKIKIYD